MKVTCKPAIFGEQGKKARSEGEKFNDGKGFSLLLLTRRPDHKLR